MIPVWWSLNINLLFGTQGEGQPQQHRLGIEAFLKYRDGSKPVIPWLLSGGFDSHILQKGTKNPCFWGKTSKFCAGWDPLLVMFIEIWRTVVIFPDQLRILHIGKGRPLWPCWLIVFCLFEATSFSHWLPTWANQSTAPPISSTTWAFQYNLSRFFQRSKAGGGMMIPKWPHENFWMGQTPPMSG